MNKDYLKVSFLLTYNRNKLKLSMWNTLSSQTPMCIFYHFLLPFLTFFLTFFFTKQYIHHHGCSGRTSVCPETHQSQHAWQLPNPGYVFPTCCLLVCRPIITFSFTAFREDVHRDGVDIKYIVFYLQTLTLHFCSTTHKHTQIWMQVQDNRNGK